MTEELKQNRIREIDFCRGGAILIMVAFHFFCFAIDFGKWDYSWSESAWAIKEFGGLYFFFLSGVVSRFAHKSIKRGLIVFACGMMISAASWWLIASGREDMGAFYSWGPLQTIGIGMMLLPMIKKLPDWMQLVLGAAIIALGYYMLAEIRVIDPRIFPLGLITRNFKYWEFKPLCPYLGWFIFGVGAGNLIYRSGKPVTDLHNVLLEWVGRNSLLVYVVHLPLFYILFKTILYKG